MSEGTERRLDLLYNAKTKQNHELSTHFTLMKTPGPKKKAPRGWPTPRESTGAPAGIFPAGLAEAAPSFQGTVSASRTCASEAWATCENK